MPDLVEVILVQLADETGKVAVFEMFGQDGFGESLILRQVRFATPAVYRWDRLREPRNCLLRHPIGPPANTTDPRAFSTEVRWDSCKAGDGTILVELSYLGTMSKIFGWDTAEANLQNRWNCSHPRRRRPYWNPCYRRTASELWEGLILTTRQARARQSGKMAERTKSNQTRSRRDVRGALGESSHAFITDTRTSYSTLPCRLLESEFQITRSSDERLFYVLVFPRFLD